MTRKPYTPRPYAPAVNAHLLAHERCALFAGMGTGKTVLVLTHLDFLWHEMGDHRLTLVLGPARVVEGVWAQEAAAWAHLKRLRVVPVVGDRAAREAALAQPAHVYCVSYDNIRWLREHYQNLGRPWPFKRLVPDEMTRLKSFRVKQGGKRASALGEVAWSEVESVIGLTGTPSPNGLKDLWGQMWFIDKGQRLGKSYSAFESRWFGWRRASDAVGYKPQLQPVIFDHSEAQIHEALADVCLTIDPKDWFDLREPIANTIEVEMPPTARRHYRELEKELFTALQDGSEIEVFNAAAKTMKCLQLANGAAYLEDGVTWREVHTAKIEALRSVIEEAAGAPVIVAYHFKSDLARLQQAFPQGRTLDKKSAVDEWNAGKIPVLFLHPASAGHGLSLQHGGNILAFFSLNWNLEEHQQIIERIGPTRQAQSGYDRAVFIHYILARGTIDQVIKRRLESKVSVQQALLDYMKRKA